MFADFSLVVGGLYYCWFTVVFCLIFCLLSTVRFGFFALAVGCSFWFLVVGSQWLQVLGLILFVCGGGNVVSYGCG